MDDTHLVSGWLPTGLFAILCLGSWLAAVLFHGLFLRSLRGEEIDPIRPSGPVG